MLNFLPFSHDVCMSMGKVAKAYDQSSTRKFYLVLTFFTALSTFIVLYRFISGKVAYNFFFTDAKKDSTSLFVATWNMAAINNNPFEYWISTDMLSYNLMMEHVSTIMDQPGDVDRPLSQLLTDNMLEDLMREMKKTSLWSTEMISGTLQVWLDDWSKKTAISGFLKDATIGRKRLTSMPDRVTNTLADSHFQHSDSNFRQSVQHSQYRPTPVNCYPGPLNSLQEWWTEWLSFMFHGPPIQPYGAASLLVPLKRAKYPVLTEREESLGPPLQLLALALFDVSLLHLVSLITWRMM